MSRVDDSKIENLCFGSSETGETHPSTKSVNNAKYKGHRLPPPPRQAAGCASDGNALREREASERAATKRERAHGRPAPTIRKIFHPSPRAHPKNVPRSELRRDNPLSRFDWSTGYTTTKNCRQSEKDRPPPRRVTLSVPDKQRPTCHLEVTLGTIISQRRR